jgi:hypothetical protein
MGEVVRDSRRHGNMATVDPVTQAMHGATSPLDFDQATVRSLRIGRCGSAVSTGNDPISSGCTSNRVLESLEPGDGTERH